MSSYQKAADICHKYNIEVICTAMVGLPGETFETMKHTFDYFKNVRNVNEVTYNIAIPYPGTEMLDMAKRGDYDLELLSEDYPQYRRHIGVMRVGKLSLDDLSDAKAIGYDDFYSNWRRIIPLIHRTGLKGFILTKINGLRAKIRRKKRVGVC